MSYRKKLIEVSLPLQAINRESAREKSIRHGHPSTLHLWWARRPLATCRAVLWSSLVDDPAEYMPDEESANRERERLFSILEQLVKWENSQNERVLDAAKLEIARSVARNLGCEVPIGKHAINEFLAVKAPPVLDPFAGGGSIPLEAQRLGLRAYASDLNPVAVLINKAMIEIPPQFAESAPVHPPDSDERQGSLLKKTWKGTEGLAEDVSYYGKWMLEQAQKRIGRFYPKYQITAELLTERPDLRDRGLKAGDELTVIAWLWARTVKCPNPACGVQMPLVKTFSLSVKKGNEYYVEPFFSRNGTKKEINFRIKSGANPLPDGTVNRNGVRCIACGTSSTLTYVREKGQSGEINTQLMAVVAEGEQGRIYLPANPEQESVIEQIRPEWKPEAELQGKCQVSVPLYGMETFGDLFSSRQLTALTTFSDLIKEVHQLVLKDASFAHYPDPQAYANAVTTYLSFVVDKCSDYWSTICIWHISREKINHTFSRQAIPMTWDYAETNPMSESTGNWMAMVEWVRKALLALPASLPGVAEQIDAQQLKNFPPTMISTDPPYYDNIAYADLSDFFYIWLRRSLRTIYPELFRSILVPKTQELVATPYRFEGNKHKAEQFFEKGLETVFHNLRENTIPNYPVTVFYAFKQSENQKEEDQPEEFSLADERVSTGWETMLKGLLASDFEITGTWPMRTELANRINGLGANSLASSIVLVCRPRAEDAPCVSRREFLTALSRELPAALRRLQRGNIAPVDLAQAAIGPGMAVFSRYQAVLEANGSPMSVHTALSLINQSLDEYLAEQESEYDSDSRWALAWFEQFGHEAGPYGVAETLSKAKNTGIERLTHAGFLEARAGTVRLLRRDELAKDWDPSATKRLTVWETTQYLIRALDEKGETGAGSLLAKLSEYGETIRDLAYRLYTLCERKGWAQDAMAYNMLIIAWPRLKDLSDNRTESVQESLL